MKFRKLSENKIHCIISQEEMDEKGIAIDDFLEHQDKTEEFLREILAEAKYELDIKDMGYYYSVQLSVMPEGDVSLVISSEGRQNMDDTLTEFGKRLQDFKEIMSEAKKQLEAKKPLQQEAKASVHNPLEEKLSRPIWVRTGCLENCIAMAKNLQFQGKLDSALYKYDDEYFLRLSFTEKEHQVAGTILIVSEYSAEVFTDEQGGGLLLEHAVAICKDHAIEMLAQL